MAESSIIKIRSAVRATAMTWMFYNHLRDKDLPPAPLAFVRTLHNSGKIDKLYTRPIVLKSMRRTWEHMPTSMFPGMHVSVVNSYAAATLSVVVSLFSSVD